MKGEWERWCEFFLEGVAEIATKAAKDAKLILSLLERDKARIAKLGRSAESALKVHGYLLKRPYLSITKAAQELGISVPTVTSSVMKLVELGTLEELTGHARNRVFAYKDYLAILTAGTAPLNK